MPPRPVLALCAALALTGPVHAFDLEQMTDAERQAFRDEIRAYLLENPEVLMEAIGVLEQRDQQAQLARDETMVQASAEALFNDGHSFVGGNPQGDITIVEFMDYRCGYCKRAFAEVEELIATDGNIRFIVKELPILGEASVMASRFAVATQQIAGDAAYKNLHDAMMTMRGDVTIEALTRLAQAFDLDADAIVAAMDSDAVTAVIAANHALADQLQITGTPTFVMQDQMVRGYVPLDQMRAMVDDLRDG